MRLPVDIGKCEIGHGKRAHHVFGDFKLLEAHAAFVLLVVAMHTQVVHPRGSGRKGHLLGAVQVVVEALVLSQHGRLRRNGGVGAYGDGIAAVVGRESRSLLHIVLDGVAAPGIELHAPGNEPVVGSAIAVFGVLGIFAAILPGIGAGGCIVVDHSPRRGHGGGIGDVEGCRHCGLCHEAVACHHRARK